MNDLSVFEQQNAQLNQAFDKVLAGTLDASIAQAASSLMNAKTRRVEIQLKQAVKGGYVKELAPRWRKEHLPSSATASA